MPLSLEHTKNKVVVILLYTGHNNIDMCLNSIKASFHESTFHHHLAFINLSSCDDGLAAVTEKFAAPLSHTVYDIPFTPKQSKDSGGMVGYVLNRAISDSDAEIAMLFRDCDEMHPRCVTNILGHFRSYPASNLCYSHILPIADDESKLLLGMHQVRSHRLNGYVKPLNIVGLYNLHFTQVAWRTKVNIHQCVWFSYPLPLSEIFIPYMRGLYEAGGVANYSGCTTHYFLDDTPKEPEQSIIVTDMTEEEKLFERAKAFWYKLDFVNARIQCADLLRKYPLSRKGQELMRSLTTEY